MDDFTRMEPEALAEEIGRRIARAKIPALIVTLGSQGAVYAGASGECGFCPPESVTVRDTSGAGDAFCAGVAIGLTYGKTMCEAVKIGTHLAASVVTLSESTCPRFQPRELGLDLDVK